MLAHLLNQAFLHFLRYIDPMIIDLHYVIHIISSLFIELTGTTYTRFCLLLLLFALILRLNTSSFWCLFIFAFLLYWCCFNLLFDWRSFWALLFHSIRRTLFYRMYTFRFVAFFLVCHLVFNFDPVLIRIHHVIYIFRCDLSILFWTIIQFGGW